jgi:hypothetical protein
MAERPYKGMIVTKLILLFFLVAGAFSAQAEKSHFGLYKLDGDKNCYLAIAPAKDENWIYLSGVGNCVKGILATFPYKKADDGFFEYSVYRVKFTDDGLELSEKGKDNDTEKVPRFEPEQK